MLPSCLSCASPNVKRYFNINPLETSKNNIVKWKLPNYKELFYGIGNLILHRLHCNSKQNHLESSLKYFKFCPGQSAVSICISLTHTISHSVEREGSKNTQSVFFDLTPLTLSTHGKYLPFFQNLSIHMD